MTLQHTPQSSGQPFGFPGMPFGKPAYVYEIDSGTGLAIPTITLLDLTAVALKPIKMGSSRICPVKTGAAVSSVTGGVVRGFDMYGQHITETIGAAGTGLIAFASVISGPADVKWANVFGLPYRYSAAAAVPTAQVTITAPDVAKDARGTFVYAGSLATPVELEVRYTADRANPFGTAYAPRYAAGVVNSIVPTVTGTIADTGVVTLATVAVSAGKSTGMTITYPDGHTHRAVMGVAIPNHTLSPIWVSQYGSAIRDDAAAVDRLVAVAFDAPEIENVYANLSGSAGTFMLMSTAAPMNASRSAPEGPASVAPWAHFTTHAQINDWVDEFQDDDDNDELELPDAWSSMTISEKKAFLDANVDPAL